MADLNQLTAALGSFDERMKAAAKPVQEPRPTYAEARAAQDAAIRAGDVHRTHDIKGQFNGVTRIAHYGPRPAAPVKVAKVEARRPVTVERDRRASVVGLSAEV